MYKLKRHFGTSRIKQVCKQYALECYRAQKKALIFGFHVGLCAVSRIT